MWVVVAIISIVIICTALTVRKKPLNNITQAHIEPSIKQPDPSNTILHHNNSNDLDHDKNENVTIKVNLSLDTALFADVDKHTIRDYTVAYQQIMETVDWNFQDKVDLFPQLLWNFSKGLSGRDSELLIYELVGGAWNWEWLDQSISQFKEYGKMPYMLDKMPTLANPTTLDEVIPLLTVLQLKACLKNKGMPSNGKRDEIEKAVLECSTFDDVQGVLSQRLSELNIKQAQRIARYKCKLLVHTLDMRAYSLRNLRTARQDKRNLYQGEELVVYLSTVGDQYDDVEKWATQNIKRINNQCCPPFYVGDRTLVCLKRIRQHRSHDPIDGIIAKLS